MRLPHRRIPPCVCRVHRGGLRACRSGRGGSRTRKARAPPEGWSRPLSRRVPSPIGWPLRIISFDGRCRSRTCGLQRVMLALWPAELTARMSQCPDQDSNPKLLVRSKSVTATMCFSPYWQSTYAVIAGTSRNEVLPGQPQATSPCKSLGGSSDRFGDRIYPSRSPSRRAGSRGRSIGSPAQSRTSESRVDGPGGVRRPCWTRMTRDSRGTNLHAAIF